MKAIKKVTNVEFTTKVDFSTFVYLPDDFSPDSCDKWPAILFLHGRAELGKEYSVLPDGGLHNFVEMNSFPLVVLEPQCPPDSEWVFELDSLAKFLSMMVSEYNLDPSRIYLTGLSMGGIGAWHLGIKYPDLFAAILPIAGGSYPFLGFPEAVARLKDVPVWAFHGLNDEILPVRLTQVLVDHLVRVNGDIRYTYYEDSGHDAWTKTYTNIEVYEWLLEKKRE